MSHSTSRKGIPSAAAFPLDSKAIAASVTSQKTQPTPQSIPPMLKVIASDAATASIRRSTIRFSIKGLSVSEDPSEISVATWSRRDVTRFTRGIMAFSRNVQLARLTTLCRAVWSWRDNVRGQIDPQGGDGAAGFPPAVVASERGLPWDGTERRESLSLTLTKAQTRLNTVYLHEMHRNESLRQSLGAARQSLAVAQATPSSSEHTKRYLLLHMTAGLRRRLRNGFSQWKAFACRAQDAQRLSRLELQLSLGAQTVLSRERLVLEKAQANVDLTWLMKRASCFYSWKMFAVQGKIDDSRAFHADMRASIARSVRELRDLELSHLSAESRALKMAESAGLELSEALRRLQTVAVGGVSKSLSRLTSP